MEEMFRRVMSSGGPQMGELFIQTGALLPTCKLQHVKVWVVIQKNFNLSTFADVGRDVLLDCYYQTPGSEYKETPCSPK